MLIKTLNSMYQLSFKGSSYTLIKVEGATDSRNNPARIALGRVWIGDQAVFEKDGCLHFRESGVTTLRTSRVVFVEPDEENLPFKQPA